MAGDIWMPVYIGDYLAATTRLTTEQHGAYLLLLMDYWKNGPLPDDDGVLAHIARLSPRAWEKSAATLRQFFGRGEDGKLHQKRADEELARAARHVANKKERSRKGNEKRWGSPGPIDPLGTSSGNPSIILQGFPEGEPKESLSIPPLPLPLPSPSPEVLKSVSEAKASSPRRAASGLAAAAAAVYATYPRKEGRGAALKAIESALKRLVSGEDPQPAMEKAAAIQFLTRKIETYARSAAGQNPDRTKIPHPATWFNQSRYLDDESCWLLTNGSASAQLAATKLKATVFDGESI